MTSATFGHSHICNIKKFWELKNEFYRPLFACYWIHNRNLDLYYQNDKHKKRDFPPQKIKEVVIKRPLMFCKTKEIRKLDLEFWKWNKDQ